MADINKTVAGHFHRMAAVMQITGADRFRINAFTRAARAIESLAEDLGAIGPDLKRLTAIDGIGKGTAQRIASFLETGTMPGLAEVLESVPVGLLELLEIPSLGPKSVALLWKEAGITSLGELKQQLNSDKLAELPGFGVKTLENLRKSIAFAEAAGERARLGEAMPMARFFVAALESVAAVRHVAYAGSLRRGRSTIGDLDIIVAAAGDAAQGISDHFVALKPVTEVLVKGETKTSVRTDAGMQVDLRVVAPEQFGAALMYFTGSKEHNIAMRQRAIERGMRLNEYGLLDGAGANVASATEEQVFAALDLAWIPPEQREGRGELAAAGRGPIGPLVTVQDITAELHAHTTASDGRWSIEALALAAADRGFHTVAVTDHSRGQVQANGLSIERLESQLADVAEARAKLADRIHILAGSEVDILSDGRLDFPDTLLAQLDIVVASPHAALSQNPAQATKRLLRAIENPYVTILGHPTGRLINRREGLRPDIKEVAHAAAEHQVALEINANSWRLDLRDVHARVALEAGARLAINTDAHSADHLDELMYGVMTARRAGAGKDDVINCLSRKDLLAWLATRRA